MKTVCDSVLSSPSFDEQHILASDVLRDVFHFSEKTTNVIQLHIHFPHEHTGIITNQATTLTAYFKANADTGLLGEEARKHTYQDFPQFFVYNPLKHEWKLCQRGIALGRMNAIEPNTGELFYLKVLLTIVKGAVSLFVCFFKFDFAYHYST